MARGHSAWRRLTPQKRAGGVPAQDWALRWGGPDVMRASQSQKDEHSSPHAQCLKVSDS